MNDVKNQNLWNFELGSQESMNVLTWNITRFPQRALPDSLYLNNDTFCRLPIVNAQCIFGTEKYPDAGIFLNYVVDHYCQGYAQIKEAFRALTKDDILQPYISDHDFRSSNVRGEDVGFNFYVFEIRYQQIFTASQPIKGEFNFIGVFRSDFNG